MNADQASHTLRQLAAIYRDAGDNSKSAGLIAFANLLSESRDVTVAKWCKSVAHPAKKKQQRKSTKRVSQAKV